MKRAVVYSVLLTALISLPSMGAGSLHLVIEGSQVSGFWVKEQESDHDLAKMAAPPPIISGCTLQKSDDNANGDGTLVWQCDAKPLELDVSPTLTALPDVKEIFVRVVHLNDPEKDTVAGLSENQLTLSLTE